MTNGKARGGGAGTRVTATMVARRAGVSQSAVSRTFSPGASVAPETRERVMRVAAELGYSPNALARSLITRRSYIIGVVMAYLDNHFYPELLERLSEKLRDHNYQVLLFTGIKQRNTDPVAEQVLQYQVDGLILASTVLSSKLAESCLSANIPLVLLNRTTRHEASSVASRNLEGGKKIASFLLAGGHQSFAYIAGFANSSTNEDRQRGYVERLAEAGKVPVVVDGHYSYAGAAEAARALLTSPAPPDAIFCANDHMAFAAVDVARHELGLRIPQDVSIVGYDNAGPARWPSYDLTTIEQPIEEMAEATVEVLLGQIEATSSQTVRKTITGDLIVGSSARKPSTGLTLRAGRLIWNEDL